MGNETLYPDHFTKRLHIVWGDGFLSPGGPEEVSEILSRFDLTGKRMLDIGYGTGGPAVHLARNTDIAKIIGVDVEAQLCAQATERAERAGVADKLDFRVVEPGPLPFPDQFFDIVFSKDAIIQISDKAALFQEAFRVLKPGGWLCASDWLGSTDPVEQAEMKKVTEKAHLHFEMAAAPEIEAMLSEAGFSDVSSRDRNAWFSELCEQEVVAFNGPLYQELVEAVGKDIVDPWIEVRKGIANAARTGGLRPTHYFGHRPD